MFDETLLPLIESGIRKALLLSAYKGVCARINTLTVDKKSIIIVEWCPTGQSAHVKIELTTNDIHPTTLFAATIIVHDDEESPVYFVTRAWKLSYIQNLERLYRSDVRSKSKKNP